MSTTARLRYDIDRGRGGDKVDNIIRPQRRLGRMTRPLAPPRRQLRSSLRTNTREVFPPNESSMRIMASPYG
jgi:hypothetical protein